MTPGTEFPGHWLKQATRLSEWSADELLEVLGLQLLARDEPAVAGGIVQYVGLVVAAGEARRKADAFPSEALIPASLAGLGDILQQSRERARAFLENTSTVLHKAICTEEGVCRPEVSKALDIGHDLCVQQLVPVIGSALGLPPSFWPIALTVAIFLMKTGLENFCHQPASRS